jgi:hypothetical protein
MVSILNLYMDDSGTRHPDRNPGRVPQHGYDWFNLGGILVKEEDEESIREQHSAFCASWHVPAPLRSADIRSRSGKFHWLNELSPNERDRFYEELYQLLASVPVLGIACVIDRPGYNHRYRERYGRQRWLLCKTAFSVAVERSLKHAERLGRKLKVYIERCDKETDAMVKGYYNDLRQQGMPFSTEVSAKYVPLQAEKIGKTLYDFKTKDKTSPMIQLADLYLWPMCIGGYDKSNRPYSRLMSDRKLMDAHLHPADISVLGIKYSCFELVSPKP